MNKYQEALDFISILAKMNIKQNDNITRENYDESLDTLQELVDKETPKEVVLCVPSLNGYVEVLEVCPSCEIARYLKKYFKYCPYCGQKLDWSEANGNNS